MFFKVRNQKKIFAFDETYLTLISSNNINHIFEVRFSLPIIDLFKLNAFKLLISAFHSNDTANKPYLAVPISSLLARKQYHLFKYFSNADLNALKNEVSLEKIQSFQKKINVLKNVDELPIDEKEDFFKTTSNLIGDSSTINKIQQKLYDFVFNDKLSPSEVYSLSNKDNIDDVKKYILGVNKSVESFNKKVVVVQATKTLIDVVEQFTIPANSNVNTFFLKFDLIDDYGNVVDSEVKTSNLFEQISIFNLPIAPPKASRGFGVKKNAIELSNFDNKTKHVKIYSKPIVQNKSETFTETLILDVENNVVRYVAPQIENKTSIYRFVPVSKDGNESFEFTDVVIGPPRRFVKNNPILTTRLSESGIYAELSNIPGDVAAVQFFAKNKTTFSNERSIEKKIVITDEVRTQNYISVLDTNVKQNNIYEYFVKFDYDDGVTSQYGHSLIEFIQYNSLVLTNIENLNLLTLENDDLNVTFDFNTTLLDNDFDILYSLLKSSVIDEYFFDEIKNDRQKLKKLIAHQVFRTNMTTGEKEDCGVHVDSTYDDVRVQKTYKQKKLNAEHKYRYEVFPLLRNSETLIESYVKTSIDQQSKRQYTFKPSKFLHPKTLSNGIILSELGKKILYAKNDMTYGIVGNVTYIDITFDNQTFKLTSCAASLINAYQHKIAWNYIGDARFVDHIVIVKEMYNFRSIVGKISSTSIRNGYCIYNLRKDDLGQIRYTLIPVYNDYSMGDYQSTNVIEVLNVYR